jgi:hypothetical protein
MSKYDENILLDSLYAQQMAARFDDDRRALGLARFEVWRLREGRDQKARQSQHYKPTDTITRPSKFIVGVDFLRTTK